MSNLIDISAINKKRQYKLRGVFLCYQPINAYLGKVFISKGAGSKKQIYAFIVTGKLVKDFIALAPKYRIKVWFTIKCREYKGNWFTDLIIDSYEHWAVNEAKLLEQAKQLQISQDNLYSQSFYKK